MDNSYIKLSRKIMQWEWYKNEHTKNVFIHCLLKAYWKDTKIEGKIIPRGSFVSSVGKIAEELQLTPMEVRTALKHLNLTNEITSKGTNRNTVFTVTNYDLYQANEQTEQQTDNEQITSKQQTINKPLTTNEEYKKDKNIKNNKNAICKSDYENLFEELWKLYPNKKGKGQVSDAAKKRLLKVGRDEMVRAIERYKNELEKDDWRIPQNGSTFFNSGYVDYLDENYEPTKRSARQKKNGFNDFKQNDYDFDALEKELLGDYNFGVGGQERIN